MKKQGMVFMDRKEKGQIATEYMILTAFILVSVAIIFTFSFVNYTQNIKIGQANEVIAKIANGVDDVYTRGEGNTRFIDVFFPDSLEKISIVHKCVTGRGVSQGSLSECSNPAADSYDYIEFSAIAMEVQLLGGTSRMLRPTKAKIFEDLGEIGEQTGGFSKYSGSGYVMRISWAPTGEIQLEKV